MLTIRPPHHGPTKQLPLALRQIDKEVFIGLVPGHSLISHAILILYKKYRQVFNWKS